MRSFSILFFILIHHHAVCAKAKNPRKNLIVEFNPYVSFLDSYNPHRYNISELLPLFEKVATKFDHVLIDLKDTLDSVRIYFNTFKFPPDLSSSLLLAPLAAATYNSHLHSSQPKLEVWLAISGMPDRYDLINASRHLKYIAEMANDIYEGTVTTMLLAHHYSFDEGVVKIMQNEKAFQASLFNRAYKWGVLLEHSHCGPEDNNSFAQKIREFKFDIAVLGFKVERMHSNLASDCKPYKGNGSLTFWFRPQKTGSAFLEQWTRIQKFSECNDMPVIVSSAFDTYRVRRSDGWWGLKENPDYSTTSEYIFETKKDIAESGKSPINLTLVAKNEPKLPSEHLGIRFSFEALTPTEIQVESLEIKKVLQAVIARYSKIVITLFDNSSEKAIADELNFVARHFLNTTDIFLYVPYNRQLNVITIGLIESILIQPAPNYKPAFIVDFDHQSNDKLLLIRNQTSWDTKIHSVFHISYCLTFETLPHELKTQVVEAVKMSDNVFFGFEEDDVTYQLGADERFQQRAVTFKQCRKFPDKVKSFNGTIGNFEIGFLMQGYKFQFKYYDEKEQAFYNFVRYWDKVREWAAKKETTVVMSGVLDQSGRHAAYLGWWRRKSDNEMGRANSPHQFVDKRMDLFGPTDAITELKIKEQDRDGHNAEFIRNQIVAISVSVCLAMFFLVSIPICFLVQKYYKRDYLSSSEVNDFFRGNQNPTEKAHQFKLPYDKSKFEIETKRFSIDHARVLGSGEFGMVCPGKVEKSDGELVDVAVKMVNTNKHHKSALTSLLSEIKVLAHVGKHENIIELLGAFTAELKRGKIFVFLELGQCGSLEEYLKNLCPEQNPKNNESFFEEDGVELGEMQTYVNTAAGNLVLLDASLSDDLYRWSREICSGMSFLASKRVVHADLATRNILMNAEKTAKICDFGLSRRMYNYTNYVKRGQDPLPWKWMSPESLTFREFNEKSDVWAYGVTLWEIYSLGATPYPGLSWDPNFSQMLERGFRMGKPKYNDRNMYSMMKKCWSTNPLGRPCFADLLVSFQDDKIVG